MENKQVKKDKPLSKNKKRRDNKKKKKIQNNNNNVEENKNNKISIKEEKMMDDDVVIDYIMPTNPLQLYDENNKNFDSYQKIFEKFYSNTNIETENNKNENTEIENNNNNNNNKIENKKEEKNGEEKEEEKRLTKKERKEQKRLKVSILKQLTDKPAIVESHDVTSSDPLMLVYLKSYRNYVSVPRHWLRKRKYLQGKRGTEKKPYKLPKYLQDTGVIDLREAAREKDQSKSTKQKARERVQPKMLKGEIDYQSLHDAFFVHQTKPSLTFHGDLYYEGKEFDVVARSKVFRPVLLSNKLREALGMPKLRTESDDPLSSLSSYEEYFSQQNEQSLATPPPWLMSMQRWGPPPSYPKLKIPGVSSPLPNGAKWGFNPGQWGKPPVDNFGHPLWGDLFGNSPPPIIHHYIEDIPEEQKKWRFGQLSTERYSEDNMEEEEEQEEENDVKTEKESPSRKEKEGTEKYSSSSGDFLNQIPEKEEAKDELLIGITDTQSLVPSERVDLRKDQQDSKQLYQVLDKQSTNVSDKSIYGSSHKYIFNSSINPSNSSSSDKVPLIKNLQTDKQVITLDPNEMESLENKNSGRKLLLEKFEEKVAENKKDFKSHKNKDKDKYKDFKF
eukprot:TRINITY_DN7594_c0_g1_i2.p1 TRINITY_DN7594_c0_g1~~TRINITY_DN7594_c0_g1_i2.p1  ORF type:complete len:615 (-),score=274.77 TRINITY_DN7594_c0_g1_i2:30-1874(-)